MMLGQSEAAPTSRAQSGGLVAPNPGHPPDFTGDGLVGGADVAAFGNFFAQSADEADFDPNEVIDSTDALLYQQIGVP